jgi:Fe-S oxidoreductase
VGETRETFAGLAEWQIILWYGLIVVSTAIFLWGVSRLASKYRRGRAGGRPDRPVRRAWAATRVVLTHAWIRRRDGVAGMAHFLVFYGFVVLFIGTGILAFQDDFAEPVLGWDFWHGPFYLGYSLFLDLFGAMLVVGLLVFAVKRARGPARYDYARVDGGTSRFDRARYRLGDWLFVGTLLFLGVSGFLLEALRIAWTNPSFETWAPVGWLSGQALRGIGLGEGAAADLHFALWWLHGVGALTFVAAIPFTKAVHMMTGPASVAARDDIVGRRLPMVPPDAAREAIGYGVITDLSPKHLLELDACTKCGKCHVACPATATGYPLSPRDLVLDLREVAEGAIGLRDAVGVGPLYDASTSILGDPIKPETLWSCMQCMACVEICPVGIEHVPIINQLRRRLVDEGRMDAQLQSTLQVIYDSGNSFGEPKRKRARWAKELDFKVKDARKEPVEILWFVGDYASLDPRNQRATRALAEILHHAGVDFGILYEAERNAGNDVRRVGEEGLFTDLAASNIDAISKCEFSRILTSDPHTYNTLKNEYPQLGGDWTVLHHSELLLELFETGALVVRREVGRRVTYHDPCALGRYNGVYEPPRRLLETIGCDLVEMPRNRDNSFCCGAGGGRIWMAELREGDGPRPSESRIDEATALGDLDHFVVACPKDVTMYEDAIKTTGRQDQLTLAELSELVLAAVAAEPAATDVPVPSLHGS